MKSIFFMMWATIALCMTSANASSVLVRDPGLVPYVIVDEVAIPESLTGVKGDPNKGRKLAINRKRVIV